MGRSGEGTRLTSLLPSCICPGSHSVSSVRNPAEQTSKVRPLSLLVKEQISVSFLWWLVDITLLAQSYHQSLLHRLAKNENKLVNSEIFARILFSRNFAYAKFRESKTLVRWWYHSVVYWYRWIILLSRNLMSQICLLRLFTKIKFMRKFPIYSIWFILISVFTQRIFAYWVILHAFWSSADFFSKSTFSKNSYRNTISVSNSLDPDQAWHFVRPDLGPNCLQRL